MINPDCVLRAGLLNSIIAEFCQSTSDMPKISVDSSPDDISRHERILKDLLKRASYLIEEIEIWNASIPPHWKKQYQFQGIDVAAVSAASPPDPWTVTFLAITHTAQIVFYLPVLSCCKQIKKHVPGYSMPNFPGDIAEFCATVENQVVVLLKIICFTVSSNIGFLDSNLTFHPVSTVKFANSNTLLWPMWTVVNCPLASKDQTELCRQALEYIGQAFGHKLALSLSNQAPGVQTSFPD
ncbi:hypothetical protein N7507_011768 [Penicillium longicatenatum]|nr:hypothetical protein N7507_011768 [Penicillium longicatenatum]